MFDTVLALVLLDLTIMGIGCSRLPPAAVAFSQSSGTVSAYDFVEITARISTPHPRNPFTESTFDGKFETADGTKQWDVEGFCDSADGGVFRIRFMPSSPGDYKYAVTYRQAGSRRISQGTFRSVDGHRRGPLRIDPRHPWHFIWEGTGEHFFFNGTTAYWLMGWRDERVIAEAIERLHRLKVNRMRVTIAGRTNIFYGERAMNGDAWTPFLTPWPAAKPDDLSHPGFDYTRFDVGYWQKFERALRYARERDMNLSLVLDMNDSQVHPFAGSVDEYRFIHYAVDRLGAFSNITWDLGDDLDRYRADNWTHTVGTTIKAWDPYRHLATSHPVRNEHQDRTSDWFDFTSFQDWSRNQHTFMTTERQRQAGLGRIIPQTNEEYGYEDHYPLWAPRPDGDSADALRRTAWEIVMAGAYQTSGETVRRGTHIWPDTGGGWMNGRGDGTMTMFEGYAHMVDFFTSFEWWKTEPDDDLVNRGNYCLASRGEIYAVYLPRGGSATVRLAPGVYDATWWNAMTGEKIEGPRGDRSSWISPPAPANTDWALLLQRSATKQ